ncbi:MAG: hypothetical protein ACRELA_15675, partial [Candidatus Rokuibacteriota bacterium]
SPGVIPVPQSPPAGAEATAPEGGPAAGPGDGRPLLASAGPKRPGRYGLTIQFESRPDDPELGRLVESTVYVNEEHPAYRRAAASRSEGYHLALAVALALAPLAAEPDREHPFVTAFLTSWGEAVGAGRGRGRRR